jgi:hypothetical protein
VDLSLTDAQALSLATAEPLDGAISLIFEPY